MNYKRIHDSIIENAKFRIINGYKEKHHIIPKCMGGTDDKHNLVFLTPEEHYVIHQLLIKIYPDNHSLIKAAVMMIPNRPNNKMYGWLKRRFSVMQSHAQTGKNNSQYGTRWIYNVFLKQSKKIKKSDLLPEGWEEGRIVDFEKYANNIKQKNKEKKEKPITKEQILKKIRTKHYNIKRSKEYRNAKAKKLFKEFKESRISLRKFAETKNMVPMTLSKLFKEFIVEYSLKPRISAKKQIK
jgi:hypothetical protein